MSDTRADSNEVRPRTAVYVVVDREIWGAGRNPEHVLIMARRGYNGAAELAKEIGVDLSALNESHVWPASMKLMHQVQDRGYWDHPCNYKCVNGVMCCWGEDGVTTDEEALWLELNWDD